MPQLFSLCSPSMTRANRSAVFPPVHQRMTRIRLCPRAGKSMRIVAGIGFFLGLVKKILRKFIIVLILASKKIFELDKSLPTGWMKFKIMLS